jgi:hypothetical protein
MIISDNMSSDDINAIVYEAVGDAAEAVGNLIDLFKLLGWTAEDFIKPYYDFMGQLEGQSVASGGDRLDLAGKEAFYKLISGEERNTLL